MQCWGDNGQFDGEWTYQGVKYSDDVDFEDFMILWAFNPTTVQAPTVSVKINGAVADYSAAAPAAYTVSWNSANVTGCKGQGELLGEFLGNSDLPVSGQGVGTYVYTMTCTNGVTSVKDTRRAVIHPPPPSVDLRIDGESSYAGAAPAAYTLSWSSANTSSCSASGGWSGTKAASGSQGIANVPIGTYPYTLTCANSAGSASDSVTAYVFAPPVVDVKVNGVDGPLALFAPAAYTVSWSSTNAGSCQAGGNLKGPVDVSGSRSYSGILPGTYTYTVRCTSLVGGQAVDSVQVGVNSRLPTVDLKVEGVDGPLTRLSPAAFTLSWSSQNATACSAATSGGEANWSGSVDLNGSRALSDVPPGAYTYGISCTNASGGAVDAVRVDVVEALGGSLTVAYAHLVLFAPEVGQPAQTLSGCAVGGEPPYAIVVHVRAPSGNETSISRSGSAWTLAPQDAGDESFGTTEQGTWTAWAVITDANGETFQTASVTWEVAWYPVHGRP